MTSDYSKWRGVIYGTTERNYSAEYAVLDKSMVVNEIRVKILPLLCRLGLVLRLGSV